MKKSEFLQLVTDSIQELCYRKIDLTDAITPLMLYVYKDIDHQCLQTHLNLYSQFEIILNAKLKEFNSDIIKALNASELSITLSQSIPYNLKQYEIFYSSLNYCEHC